MSRFAVRSAIKAGCSHSQHNESLLGGNPKNHNETLKVSTKVKAGNDIRIANHNETLAIRSGVQAGGTSFNHNESLVVRAGLKAGKITSNHNQTLRG